MAIREQSGWAVLAEAARRFRRGWLLATLVLLGVSLMAAAVAAIAVALVVPLAQAQLPLLLDADRVGVSTTGMMVLALELGIPAAVLIGLLAASGFGAVTRLLDDARQGSRPRLGASVLQGIRRCPRMLAAIVLHLLAVGVLVIVTPFLVPAGLIGLIVLGVLRWRGRAREVPLWPFVAGAIPLGAAAVVLVRGSLAGALAVLEGVGPIRALRRSWTATGLAVASTALAVLLAFGGYLLVQVGLALALSGVIEVPGVTLGLIVVQSVTFGYPLAVLAVLARMLRDSQHRIETQPGSARGLVSAVAGFTAVLMLATSGGAMPAFAAEPTSVEQGGGQEETGGETLGDEEPDDAGSYEESFYEENSVEDDPGQEEPGGTEQPAPQRVQVDDPRFRAELIVREGTRTVEGDPVTLWVTSWSTDETPTVGNYEVTYFVLTDAVNNVWHELGENQYSGWYGASSFPIDFAELPLVPGDYRFGAQVHNPYADEGPVDGPWLEVAHTVDVGAMVTSTTLSAPAQVVLDEGIPVQVTVTAADDSVPSGWVRIRNEGGVAVPDLWLALAVDGTASGLFPASHAGDQLLVASYHGAPPLTSSESAPHPVTVTKLPVTVTLSQSASSSTAGQPVIFMAVLGLPGGGLPELWPGVEFWLGDPDTGTRLGTVYPEPDGTAEFTTTALPAGANSVYAVYPGTGERHARSVSAAVLHGVGGVPVTLSISSSEGWALARGTATNLFVDAVVPEGALPLTDGTITVTIDGETSVHDLAAHELPLWFPVRMDGELIEARAVLSDSATHTAAGAVEATVTRRAAATTVVIAELPPAQPGAEHWLSAFVLGEDDYHPPGSGTLQYRLDGGAWQSLELNGAGASWPLVLDLGTYILEARYLSDVPGDFLDSPIASRQLEVGLVPTAVQPVAAGVRVGEAIQIDVGVVSVPGWLGAPTTGTISVADSAGTVLATAELAGTATASLSIPALPLGEHSLTVRYGGSALHASSSAVQSVRVHPWPTTLSLDAPGSAVSGQPVLLRATVSSAAPSTAGPFDGTVVFSTNTGLSLGSAAVGAEGVAELTVSLPRNQHQIQASYHPGESGVFEGSIDYRMIGIDRAGTTLAVEYSPSTAAVGQTVLIRATVGVNAPGAADVSHGAITFTGDFFPTPYQVYPDHETGIAEFEVIAPSPGGSTPYTFVSYSGTDQLTASYASAYLGLRQAEVTVTVTPPEHEVHAGTSPVVWVTVTPEPGADRPGYGTVTLSSGGTVLGSRTLDSATVMPLGFTVDPDALGLGTHPLTAVYSGGIGYQAATSAGAWITLVGYQTSVMLSASPAGGAEFGQPVTFTATVDAVGRPELPLGSVRFELDGVQHSVVALSAVELGSDRAAATLTLSGLTIGAHQLRAVYLPAGLAFAGSSSAVLSYQVAGRSATVYSLVPAQYAGRAGSMTVWVVAAVPPSGTVELWLDGVATGVTGTLSPSGPETSQAQLTVPGSLMTAGDRSVRFQYTPADGIHGPAQQSGSITVQLNTPTVTIDYTGASAFEWGGTVVVPVRLGRDAADSFGLAPMPSGTPAVSLLGGAECIVAGTDVFHCSPGRAGPVTVSVHYPGDANYAPASRTQTIAEASRRTTALSVSLSPSVELETGRPITLSWQLTGPDVRPEIEGLPIGAVCTGTAVGSCEFQYTVPRASSIAALSVRYPGNGDWAASEWERPMTVALCHPLSTLVQPAAAGTIEVLTPANCFDGGYRAGTEIEVRVATAGTGSIGSAWHLVNLSGRPMTHPAPVLHRLTVGTASGQVTGVNAIFELTAQCVTVSTVFSSARGGNAGQLFVDEQPNCPGATQWQVSGVPTAAGGREVTWSGRFILGSTVSAVDPVAFGGNEYYGLSIDGGPFQVRGTVTRTLSADLRIVAFFGPACHPVELSSQGPGSLRLLPNSAGCPDPARPEQFIAGSQLTVRATPDAATPLAFLQSAEVRASGLPVPVGVTTAERRQGVVDHLLTVSGPVARAAAVFAECAVMQLRPQFKGQAAGTVRTGLRSNCPVGPALLPENTWHLTPGTTTTLEAVSEHVNGYRSSFMSWNLPGVASGSLPWVTITVTEDIVLRPAFAQQYLCSTFIGGAASPGVEARLDFAADEQGYAEALGYCDSWGALNGASGTWHSSPIVGQVSAGQVTGEVRATGGNPLLGWRVIDPDHGSYGVPAGTVSMAMRDRYGIYGAYQVEAFACQEVEAFFTVLDVAGQPHVAHQDQGDFIQISPAPNCPYNPRAWIVGTELSFTAGADPRGYAFKNWEGIAGEGTELAGQKYTVTDRAPKAALMAVYDLICHKLTITGKPHRVTWAPEPTCYGAPEPTFGGGTTTGWFIGGTPVALVGEVPGGNVWQGWKGDVEKTGKVDVAVVVMDRDKAVSHNYRGKSWDEKALDFISSAGNELAITMKKVVGVGGFVVNQAFSYVPPFAAIGPVLGGLSMVGDMLADLGVPESVTKYFAYPADSFKWLTDAYLCVAAWGLSGGSASVYLGDYTDPIEDAVFDTIDSGIGTVDGATGGVAGGIVGDHTGVDLSEGSGAAAEEGYGQGGDIAGLYELGGGNLGSLGKGMGYLDTALTGYHLLTNPQGIGWDDNASDAWSYDNWSERMDGCLKAQMPDSLRAELAPDVTDEEWKAIEEKYGIGK